ncbi:hypothetical protein FOZ63_003501, partial [Perkinsus olseni]
MKFVNWLLLLVTPSSASMTPEASIPQFPRVVSIEEVGKFSTIRKPFDMTLDVYNGSYVAATFAVSGQRPFIDGTYPLRGSNGAYTIDFDVSSGLSEVSRWYDHIGSLYPNVTFEEGDLETITYRADHDSLLTKFGGEELELYRVGFDLAPGEFQREDPYMSVWCNMHGATMDIVAKCNGQATDRFSFPLERYN